MQARGRGAIQPPLGIAFEGDLGQRVDTLLAVAMLNGLTAKGDARAIALSISRSNLKTAQLADVVATFYAGRPAGGFAAIGMPEAPRAGDETAALAAALSRTGPDGTPQYTSGITDLLDTADNAVLIRNVLLAQNDGNAAIVLAGPATGLARLLALYGVRPQLTAKVKHLIVAVGSYPTGPAEPDIAADVAAARTLFAEWPTPLIAVGSEVGAALPFPATSIETDFAWSEAHPVVDAYRAFKKMPYDAPTSALAAVLYAARPNEGLFSISEPGTITVLDDGRTRFTAEAGGRHRHLIVDPAQKAGVIALYRELVSAMPAPRPGRGRRGAPPNQQQQLQQRQQQQQRQPSPAPEPPAPSAPQQPQQPSASPAGPSGARPPAAD